jgi:hypothetical protein
MPVVPFSLKDVSHVLFDDKNLADGIDSLTVKVSAKVAEHHACGQVFPYNFILGLYSGELSLTGWMDSVVTTPASGGKINAVGSANCIVTVLHEGNTVSKRCWSFQSARVTEVEAVLSVDDVHKLTPAISVNGGVDYGVVVSPHAQRTTAANTDTEYADLGAAAADGVRAYLHVTALVLGAATSATVKVRHSTDHITFADKGTFTDVTAAGAECISIAGPVNQYLSTSWAYNGGEGTSIDYLVTAGVL